MKIQALKDIWKHSQGSYMIEFALVFPVFLLFTFAAFEYALMAFADVQFNAAVFSLSRTVKTGQFYNTQQTTPSQTIQAALVSQLVPTSLFTPSLVAVSAESFISFSSIGAIEPCIPPFAEPCSSSGQYNDINGDGVRDLQGGTGGTGSGSDIVVYTATYPWTGLTPVWKLVNYFNHGNSSGGSTLSASILIKSEPFPVAGR